MDENKALTVSFWFTNEFVREQFVKSGEIIESGRVSFDLALATPEQRSEIYRMLEKNKLELNWKYYGKPSYSGYPTLEQVVADCKRLADERDAKDLSEISESLKEKTRSIQASIEQKTVELTSYQLVWSHADEIARARRLGVPAELIDGYRSALAEYTEHQPEFKRLDAEARAARQAEEDRRAAQRRVDAEAAEVAKLAWIGEHGSDFLKRACLKGGYDCTRRYAIERAAFEAPGFVLDFEDQAAWKDRACPSEEALDELDAANALGIGEARIVWLTAEPSDKKESYSEEDYYFEPTEAVVIMSYLGKYDLVKIID